MDGSSILKENNMRKRYFLRGLGCGLIIGAMVMMVTFQTQKPTSDSSTGNKNNTITEAVTENSSQAADGDVDNSQAGSTEEASSEDNTNQVDSSEAGAEVTPGDNDGNGSGSGDGQSADNGNGSGSGNGQGTGSGSGSGNGQGNGNGSGSGSGNGQGNGSGSGSGNGSGNGSGTPTTEDMQGDKNDPGDDATKKGGTITVTKDMEAMDVCKLLAGINMVKSAQDFYSYLSNKGLVGSIIPGKYTFDGTEDYDTIVAMITSSSYK